MRSLIVLAVVAFAGQAIASKRGTDTCEVNKESFLNCKDELIDTFCNSLLPGYEKNHDNVVKHVNVEIARSYDYLLLASNFGTFKDNRPGFRKLYKDLSDKAWKNGIELIKYVTKRGGKMNFNNSQSKISKAELDEMNSLNFALDTEKRMAIETHHIHEHASRANCKADYDPALSHFVEEMYFEDQTETIRKLAGYGNDLKQMWKDAPTKQLATYLFDNYLQNQ